MEIKDPMQELLSSLELIVFPPEARQTDSVTSRVSALPEPRHIRETSGMQIDEFALAMGVSVASVKSWEAKRSKPSGSAQKLMQLLHADPRLGRQLLVR